MFNQWSEWTKNHQYNRAALIGQVRASLAPSATGKSAAGVNFYSMANPDGTLPFADFAAALNNALPAVPTVPALATTVRGKALDTITISIQNGPRT